MGFVKFENVKNGLILNNPTKHKLLGIGGDR